MNLENAKIIAIDPSKDGGIAIENFDGSVNAWCLPRELSAFKLALLSAKPKEIVLNNGGVSFLQIYDHLRFLSRSVKYVSIVKTEPCEWLDFYYLKPWMDIKSKIEVTSQLKFFMQSAYPNFNGIDKVCHSLAILFWYINRNRESADDSTKWLAKGL